MPDPLITLVVPTYNRATFLPATLKSLQEQEFREYEIIIVDDGSTDNTEQVVQPFLNNYTRYVKKANAERAAARNYGAKMANGRYVNFFDSDDLALPNHTAEAAKIISEKNDPEWFHLGYEWINPIGKVIKKINNRTGATINKMLATGNHLGCNPVFIRRDIFLNHLFNENIHLSASEDYELWLRLAARYPLHYSNTITSKLIDHSERSVRKMENSKIRLRMNALLNSVESDEQIMKFFGIEFQKIKADIFSYISLHISMFSKEKINAIYFLMKSIMSSSSILISKRFYAIVRNLLFYWH